MTRPLRTVLLGGMLVFIVGGMVPLSRATAVRPSARHVLAPATYQLTLEASLPHHHGKVSGSITAAYGASGAVVQLSCRIPTSGQRCSYQVPAHARVRLREHASATVSFDRWTIAGNGSSRTRRHPTTFLTMNGDYTIQAVYNPAHEYRLTVAQAVVFPKTSSNGSSSRQAPVREAGGVITVTYNTGSRTITHSCRNTRCLYQIAIGTGVQLSGTASRGFSWKGWTIKGAGVPVHTTGATSARVVVSRDYLATALYRHP